VQNQAWKILRLKYQQRNIINW